MSRIGRMPITVPAGVTVNVAEGNVVTVKGPKGELTRALRAEMIIKQEGNTITVERPSDDKLHRSLHGLTRTLLHNRVTGVTEGYIKDFKITEGGQGIIRITLKYSANHEKEITGLKRVSKPGLRVYAGAQELPQVLRGLGIAIVSTSKGVMTDKKARELHVGGEVLAFVW